MQFLQASTLLISLWLTVAHGNDPIKIERITATSDSSVFHGEAYKVVDGNSNGGVYQDSPSGVCAHTRNGDSWITLDLVSSYEIDRLEFVGRRGSCAGCYRQSSGWNIHIGNSGTASDPLCKSLVDVSGGDVITVTCDSALTGHYVTITSSTAMVLCEVDVYGRLTVEGMWKVSANSVHNGGTHFENMWKGPSTATFAIIRSSATDYDFLANHEECGETAVMCMERWNEYVYYIQSSDGDCVLTLNCHSAGYSGLTSSWSHPTGASLLRKGYRCGKVKHVSESQSQHTNSPEKCMMYVISECNNKEFFTWRSTNNACHCVEEPNCDNLIGTYGLNVYRIQDPTTEFSTAAAPGACLKTEIDDIGMILGNHPHTIQVRLTFPDTVPSVRQWILNLGQKTTGAHLWIWNSNTGGAQIGEWAVFAEQINQVDISVCTYLTTTFSGSILKLYCNGALLAQRNADFSINSPMLSIGTVGADHDFAGCISEVSIFSYEKTDEEVRRSAPVFWDTCRWQTAQDTSITSNAATATFMGWTCRDNEILTGFGLTANDKDITKIQCCSIGGHSSVMSNTCSFIEIGQEIKSESAVCGNDQDHKVFSGAYDQRARPGLADEYTEILAGKCCEVECDAGWCAQEDWGVNKDDCVVVSAQGNVAQELVCPDGTLMTEIHDGRLGGALGIQKVGAVTCCALDVVAEPTFHPSVSPSRTPSEVPSVSPSKAPTTTQPTVAPSQSPTTTEPTKIPTTTQPTVAPSLSPTTSEPTEAPTTIRHCLLQNRDTARTDKEYLEGLARCLPDCDDVPDAVRRALEGRLLQEGDFY